jgi:hypothetical protein
MWLSWTINDEYGRMGQQLFFGVITSLNYLAFAMSFKDEDKK